MEIKTEEFGTTAVVSLVGDIDALTAPEATDYVKGTIADGWAVIIIDLGQVPFMSSAGLRFLLDAHQQSQAANSQIIVAAAQHGVERVLTTSGFSRILTTYPTVEDALNPP
jgi:anti-anti-sigma factor